MDKLDFIKIKNIHLSKDTLKTNGGLTLSYFKLITKLSNKMSVVLAWTQTYRPMVQNRQAKNKHLIFDKGTKTILHRGKDSLINR